MMVCKSDIHCKLCDSSCPYYIEVEPVRHGRWTKIGYDAFNCNLCGTTFMLMQGISSMNYCPNCGAKMEEAAEIMAFWKLSPYRLTTALESFEGITAYCSECGYTINTHEGDVLPDHCPECGAKMNKVVE